MADKLSDVLSKLSEKQNDAFKEVACPSCAAKIRLYAKMEYGYCRFCAGKVSLKDAQSRKFSKQLIEHLSGEEYYTLMREGEGVDENLAKAAVEKGSLTAAVDLGRLYFGKGDYETAMHYYEIAKDGGNNDGKEWYPLAALGLGSTYAAKEDYQKAIHYFEIAKNCGNNDAKVQYVLCKDVLAFGSGNLTSSKCRKMLNDIAGFDQLELLEPTRETLNNVRNILKKTIKDEERKEKERYVSTTSSSYSSSSSRARETVNYSNTYSDPNEYIARNGFSYICGVVSDKDIEKINNDPFLSEEEKEAIKSKLDSKAALYY